MHRSTAILTVTALSGLGLALGPAAAAVADPKPVDDGVQTSVCDNGRTYVFPVVNHAADGAASYEHKAATVPGTTTVLHSVSFSGTVTIESDGAVVDSFPVVTTAQRRANPTRTTTCRSTYVVHPGPGLTVRVQGTDVFQVSGR